MSADIHTTPLFQRDLDVDEKDFSLPSSPTTVSTKVPGPQVSHGHRGRGWSLEEDVIIDLIRNSEPI